ncbi:hypothetical protein Syun_006024 [Stephania yunnanensis]|uniref:Uncharacterized protein n=1 Tax=Stephania yunnanensis TaxID=152371 RepID=A0AAP0PX61_9MAGN
MAEELIVGGAGEVVKRAISLAIDELGLVIGVKGELKKLQAVLTHIHAVLQDAEEKQVKEKEVKVWLQELKQLSYDAEDVLDEIAYNELKYSTQWLNYPLRLVARFKMAHELKAINLELDGIDKRKSAFQLKTTNNVAEPVQTFNDRETYSFVDESSVIGRDIEKKEITQLLINDDDNIALPVIAIVGIGGLGKTTIAQLVYNNGAVKNHFQLKIWISVSKDFNVKRLLREMLEATSKIAKHESSSMDLIQRCLEEKLKGRRFLLVLDDMWIEDGFYEKWEALRIVLKCADRGSTIIVTTRNGEVANMVAATSHIQNLQVLPEDDCWDLFQRRAFVSGGVQMTQALEAIGRQIVKKCGGVPLAIKSLGGMMRLKREENEWLAVKNNEIWNIPDADKKIINVLKMSFDNLPSSVKRCFSYCSIFPKGHSINKKMLIQMWMAEGFVSTLQGNMEDIGNQYFNMLRLNCFFQDIESNELGEIKRGKMHDLVHDLVQFVSGQESSVVSANMIPDDISQTRYMGYISSGRRVAFPKALYKANKLHTFFSFSPYEVPKDMFVKLKRLRVLDLSSTSIKKLPSTLCKLKHLGYLDLSMTDIEELPESITCLYHLQTLKLKKCENLKVLPRKLCKLINLRYLNIHGCTKLSRMPKGIGNLTSLQMLCRFKVGLEEDGNSITELQHLNLLRGKLSILQLQNVRNAAYAKTANLKEKSNLSSLTLSWGTLGHSYIGNAGVAFQVLDELQPHQSLHELLIEGFVGVRFPRWMSNGSLLPNLKSMMISNCSNCEHIPSFGELACLERLEIMNMSNVKSIGGWKDEQMDTTTTPQSSSYSCLKVLELGRMPNLEEWSVGNEVCSEELSIKNCPNLRMTPHSFPSLKSLKLEDVGGMGVVSITSSLTSLTSLSITRPLLPSLRHLHINGWPALQALPHHLQHLTMLKSLMIQDFTNLTELPEWIGNLASLEQLKIMWCATLTHLPSKEQMQRLTFLKRLWIFDCPCLEWVTRLYHLQTLKLIECQELVELPEDLMNLKKLRHLFIDDGEKWKKMPQAMGKLDELQTLPVENCPKLQAFKDEGLMVSNSSSLRELQITKCNALKSIPDFSNLLPSLRKLVINGWPALQALPHHLQHLTTLKSLSIKDFRNLTELPEWIGNLASLKSLQIWRCKNLTHLPSKEQMQRLTFLKRLRIQDCPRLKERCRRHGPEWPKISHIPRLLIPRD